MTTIEASAPSKLADVDRRPRGAVHPSPTSWNDEVVYHLLIDRFADGKESERPLFDGDQPQAHAADPTKWAASLKSFCGGTLKGIESKLDYLKDLGVTVLWLSPVIKQHPAQDTYHGYAMQNFLDVEPRFGSRQDLRDLVDAAHARGMYVLLDVVINHIGHCFYYDQDGEPVDTLPYRHDPPHPVHGWVGSEGQSLPQPESVNDGVWPEELQNLEWYNRCGHIKNWDPIEWANRTFDDNEFRRGDFFELKNVDLTRRDTTDAMIRIYQYWIALSDCDGFRMDTVKHIPIEAVGRFCRRIREFAASIGKERFVVIGEVTGGDDYVEDYLSVSGRNIDGFLDIGEPAEALSCVVRGESDMTRLQKAFDVTQAMGERRRAGLHLSILDDHDMVGRAKRRFAAFVRPEVREVFAAHATGVQLTIFGTPTIYYGTEQALVGDCEAAPEGHRNTYEDRYMRETLFGGKGGGHMTEGCHFFDPNHPTYLRIAALAKLRSRDDEIGFTLRKGRGYPRSVGLGDGPLQQPVAGGVIAYSRVIDGPRDVDVLVAFNTSQTNAQLATIGLDPRTVGDGEQLHVLYDGAWSDQQLRAPVHDQSVPVFSRDGASCVQFELPPGGMRVLTNLKIDG